MASNARDTTADLARSNLQTALLERGAGFEFYQVIRLLRRLGDGDVPPPRIRPALGLDLPRSEVARVEPLESGGYQVETTFLGLYGAASPLPAFYTEELIEAGQDDRHASRDFLDLIHQRMYALYTDAVEKYRPLYGAIEQGKSAFPDMVSALVGLRDPAMRRSLPEPMRLLDFVGLLGPQQRSAEGLKTLLEAALPGVAVEIEQCVPRRVSVPRRSRLLLGEQAHCLGESALLGDQVQDCTGKIRIRLGPLPMRRFQSLLGDGEEWAFLASLVRFYLSSPLECELECLLDSDADAALQLGEEGCRLGRDAWLLNDTAGGALRATVALV